jgi:predicted DNA binding protein
MRVRKANASPCARKGKDNHKASTRCESEELCKALSWFKTKSCTGTIDYNKASSNSIFKGCFEIEEYLINNQLLRYDSKEKSGLDVLFNGIEKLHSLSADHLEIDSLSDQGFSDIDLTIGEVLTSYSFEIDNNQVFEVEEENEELDSNLYLDESTLNYIPASLGYGHTMAHDIFASAPDNLDEVVFNFLYKRGEFNIGHDDLFAVARCMKQRRDLIKDIKEIWPRYTERRYIKNLELINKITENKTPFWASRFELLWNKLTPEQAQAIRAEYFYIEAEKPTQSELATRMGIKLSSYKDRLKWANKKIIKLFPEYKSKPKRNKKVKNESKPEPLYKILENGDRVQIPFPTKKFKFRTPPDN